MYVVVCMLYLYTMYVDSPAIPPAQRCYCTAYSLIAYMRNSANVRQIHFEFDPNILTVGTGMVEDNNYAVGIVNAAQVIEDKYENIDKELLKYVDYNQKKTRAFPPPKKNLFTPNPSTRLPARPHSQQRRCYHRSSQRDVARGREGRLGAC